MPDQSNAASRRQFLIRSAAVAGGLAAGISPLEAATAATRNTAPPRGPHSEWLGRLRGEEKYLLDSPNPSGGRMLALIRHFLDTYPVAYGVSADQLGVAGTFYGGTTFLGLNDAAWQRHQLGEFQDPVVPSSFNPWRTAPVIGGKASPSASITTLASRGAVFILCRAALVTRAGQVAERRGVPAAEVLADLEANLLPEVTLVPSVIIEIQRAQRQGVAYYQVP